LYHYKSQYAIFFSWSGNFQAELVLYIEILLIFLSRQEMGIRITTLSENTAGQPDLLAEWGLSLFIQDAEKNILLDSGESISIGQNSDKLGIDLQKIDAIVLSHGHFDHTGGLRTLLTKMKKKVDIIAHPDIWQAKYVRLKGRPDRYVGIPFVQSELESLGARFILTSEPYKLSDNITTTGEIPLLTDFEKIEPSLFVKTPDGWKPDLVLDDLALIIKASEGLAVALGCAHRGMINTLYHARQITGINKVNLVLGGCHLKDASEEQIWQTISALNEMGVQKLGVSHCTGIRAIMMMSQTFGSNFLFNNTGSIINLP
jgi:7,8-dihydropterin-6-yl-methyl-4-(beta-D-ribofuranosyl)aminobenzene 5'-phosphate synthase